MIFMAWRFNLRAADDYHNIYFYMAPLLSIGLTALSFGRNILFSVVHLSTTCFGYGWWLAKQ